MVLKDFLTYKRTYFHSSNSDHKQEFFMKAVINMLEVEFRLMEDIHKKQGHLERELKQIKSEVVNLQGWLRKINIK